MHNPIYVVEKFCSLSQTFAQMLSPVSLVSSDMSRSLIKECTAHKISNFNMTCLIIINIARVSI